MGKLLLFFLFVLFLADCGAVPLTDLARGESCGSNSECASGQCGWCFKAGDAACANGNCEHVCVDTTSCTEQGDGTVCKTETNAKIDGVCAL